MNVLRWFGWMGAVMAAQAFEPVVQSARDIPVVRETDVVVVGGSCAAVSAALAAKAGGAEVLLLAPRIGLGDDMTLTRELWPEMVTEFSTSALALSMFPLKVPFTYTYSAAWNNSHADTSYTRLTDGVKNNPTSHSVQFDTGVTITAVFASVGTVTGFDLYYYKRVSGQNPFDSVLGGVEVSTGGAAWAPVVPASATAELVQQIDATDATWRFRVVLPAGVVGDQVRIACAPAQGLGRQLLDELTFQTDPSNPVGSIVSNATTPLRVKRTMEAALDAAGVPFLTGAVVTDVLKDGAGQVAGVVMANRSGRQAVTARAIVDATESAVPARRAGAVLRPFPAGAYVFSRIVIADATNAPSAPGLTGVVQLPGVSLPVNVEGVGAPSGMPSSINGAVFRCTFTTNLTDGSMAERLEVEQAARDLTWVPTTLDAAERLVWMPPDTIVGAAADAAPAWVSAAAVDLDAFRPAGVPHVFVAGLRADVTRGLAEGMRNPARMMAVGERVGAAAAADALARGAVAGAALPADPGASVGAEEVRERLGGIGAAYTNAVGAVAEGARSLPVLAECDVLVVGAGTSGSPAAIAAARAGADTVVIDILNTMGGVQTDGRIGVYYHGNCCGFSQNEVVAGWKATGSVLYAAKAEWYRREARNAGARILFGTLAAGVVVEGAAARGVVAVLPDGSRAVIRARVIVDATGSSVVALAAREETEFISPAELANQGVGWARHVLGNSYKNTDVGFVDEQDVADVSYFSRRVHASLTVGADWDAGANPASRERHRIRGVFYVSPLDILNDRTYPDTIVRPRSNFDSHGFTTHTLFFVRDPGQDSIQANLPYRSLLPKTLDGVLVTGLGISAHRDAMPILRMQPDVENQGYAAGYAAWLAVSGRVTPRNISITALQDHLIAKGIIRQQDKGTPDNFPLATQTVQNAANSLTSNWDRLHVVLTDTNTALPILRAGYANASAPAVRERFATALGLLGQADGASWLAAQVAGTAAWDAGWNYKGMGQYGRSVSWLDCYIIALGRTHSAAGLQPVLAKAALLDASSAFSHHRAAAMALERIGGGGAAAQLSALLALVRGHALPGIATPAVIPGYSNTVADSERNLCLKELALATALFRVGDDTAGNARQVLEAYARDPRGVYATYAQQVLALGQGQGMAQLAADGDWIGTAPDALWAAALNWAGGTPAGGLDATAVITNAVGAPQAIRLSGETVTLGRLDVAGQPRRIADGLLDFSGAAPAVAVAAGAQATLAAAVLAAQPVAKTGGGALTFEGAVNMAALDVQAGGIAFRDADATHRQAYSTDAPGANLCFESGANLLTLRVNFTVNTPITLTGLGAFDSGGDGLTGFKRVAVYQRTGGVPLAELAFVPGVYYPLADGYRFRHLPEPLHLAPGDYAITTYGFSSTDGYRVSGVAGLSGLVGALDGGNGAVTFQPGTWVLRNDARGFPTATGSGTQNEYGVTAGSFTYLTGATPKTLNGPLTLAADAAADVGAADVRLMGGIAPGLGATLTNAGAAYPVSLTLTSGTLPAEALGDRADGPLTLVKAGAGNVSVTGALRNRGGVHIASGLLEIDSPLALGANDVSFGTGGKLAPRAGGTVTAQLYTPGQGTANNRDTAFIVPEGQTVTFTGSIEGPRSREYGGFAIQPYNPSATADAAPAVTTAILDGARLGYIDIYPLGDGLPGGATARHEWRNVQGDIRKVASSYNTVDGCSVSFGAGCNIRTGWFDVSSSNNVVSITNGAMFQVTSSLRINDGGGSSQLSLDGGILETVNMVVENTSGPVTRPVLFNGTVIRARDSRDAFVSLGATALATPLIRAGGAIFDTQGFTVGIINKGFAQELGSNGAFVKLGSGTLKIGTPMTYTGPTLVSNGTLRLDFALWRPGAAGANLLSPQTEVIVSPGATLDVAGQTNALGEALCAQALNLLASAGDGTRTMRVSGAVLEVGALEGQWEKRGAGTLAFAVSTNSSPFTGRLSVVEGALRVSGVRDAITADIPCPSFESSPLLPTSPIADMDKRGTAATGCAGWTFVNNNSGYQRNGSYFSTHADVQTTNGVQTAFICRDGSMQCTFTQPETGNNAILRFQYAPRYYSGTWYANGPLTVKVDGVAVDTFTVTERRFVTRTIPLGPLAAGAHTLAFVSTVVSVSPEPWSLIDVVSIETSSDGRSAAVFSSRDSELSLAAGVTATLDYSGAIEVGLLVIDGIVQPPGIYSSATHPGIFTGPGVIKVKAYGTLMILR